MAAASSPLTVADLLDQLGGIPPERVRMKPAPGTATEKDVLTIEAREGRLFELVDGILVEKAISFQESVLALALASILRTFVIPRNLGVVSGESGMVRLFPGLVRIPDLAFASWDRFPDGRVPDEPIPDLAPDLVIEVLSKGNTPAEMERKRREYFKVGVRLIWQVNPKKRTVAVYARSAKATVLTEADTLDGKDVLPGFALPLKELFAELDRQAPQ